MRNTLVVSLLSFFAFAALAADPPAPAAAPVTGGPGFMANAPPADVIVEDADGGARLVFKAKDAKEVEALRAWVKQMAEHLKAGCPMPGAHGMGPGMGMGKGTAMQPTPSFACPRMSASPAAPATPAAKKP